MTEQKKVLHDLQYALKGAAVTVIAGTLILLCLAWLIAAGRIPADLLEVYVLSAVIAASLIGGFVSVRIQGRSGAVSALLSGLLIILAITAASITANGLSFFGGNYVQVLAAVFGGSLSGGMLGVRRRSRSGRKRRR